LNLLIFGAAAAKNDSTQDLTPRRAPRRPGTGPGLSGGAATLRFMARPLRIEFPGALYHVTSRGNARQPIYLDDVDRRRFLEHLGEVVALHRWRCHAYCLMTNHYHLLLETPQPNLSAGMRRLNGPYAQWFNVRHDRVGHLLQGRFGAVVVERESHLAELARYVVLNPVRAGIVASPEEYAWSSLRAAVGLAAAPPWLITLPMVSRFGSPRRYLAFVHEGIAAGSPWAARKGIVLGSDEFAQRVASRMDGQAEEPEYPRKQRRQELTASLLPADRSTRATRTARNARIRELVRSGRYSMVEISRFLGLHYSTVTRIAAASTSPGEK
jgi:putative transposase